MRYSRLAYATSGYCLTNEPHLSPQLYELNAMDRTIFKGNEVDKLGGSRCADLTKTCRSDPCLIDSNITTNPVSKGGEGGKNLQ